MFVGHYSASLAAKAIEPRAPLWSYCIASQLLDVGWSVLVMVGIEKARVDPQLPGSVFDLYYMPWTHSLPAALVWSVAGAMIFKRMLRLPTRAAVFIGLAIFSHWVLDLIVHRPDLLLYPGGPKIGLGLWNYPVFEEAIEMGLVAIATVWWAALVGSRKEQWRPATLIALMTALQAYVIVSPPSGSHVMIGAMVLAAYLVVAAGAWWAEGAPKRV